MDDKLLVFQIGGNFSELNLHLVDFLFDRFLKRIKLVELVSGVRGSLVELKAEAFCVTVKRFEFVAEILFGLFGVVLNHL